MRQGVESVRKLDGDGGGSGDGWGKVEGRGGGGGGKGARKQGGEEAKEGARESE